MDQWEWVTSTAVSGGVAAVVSYTLRAYFRAAIQHRYNTEIENLKAEHALIIERLKAEHALAIERQKTFLSIEADAQHGLSERRLKAYPKIVELVYRIRNMARDLASATSALTNSSLTEELPARTNELEQALYEFRIDLERDGLFFAAHQFKNAALNYCMKLSDIRFFLKHGEETRAEKGRVELAEMFKGVEESNGKVIKLFSNHQIQTPIKP